MRLPSASWPAEALMLSDAESESGYGSAITTVRVYLKTSSSLRMTIKSFPGFAYPVHFPNQPRPTNPSAMAHALYYALLVASATIASVLTGECPFWTLKKSLPDQIQHAGSWILTFAHRLPTQPLLCLSDSHPQRPRNARVHSPNNVEVNLQQRLLPLPDTSHALQRHLLHERTPDLPVRRQWSIPRPEARFPSPGRWCPCHISGTIHPSHNRSAGRDIA